MFTDHIHSIVPVTGADQWETVLPTCESPQNGSHTVFVQRSRFVRPAREIVIRVLICVDWAAFDERDRDIQHPRVPGRHHVATGGEWEPEEIIGTARAHAPAGGGMPPMLHVSLLELTARAQ